MSRTAGGYRRNWALLAGFAALALVNPLLWTMPSALADSATTAGASAVSSPTSATTSATASADTQAEESSSAESPATPTAGTSSPQNSATTGSPGSTATSTTSSSSTPSSPSATATTTNITGGTITWGLKSSFRSYLTSSIANGEISATAPATDDGTATTFASASGTWATAISVATKGSVRFTGHHGALDLTIAAPRLVVDASGTRLVVDAAASGTVFSDLVLADVSLAGHTKATRTGVRITAAPTTLTTAGTALFRYNGQPMYAAGTALDALSAELTLDGAATIPTATTAASTTSTATARATTTAAPTTRLTSSRAGSLSWGVKQSFRSYITGPIASGTITTSRGATGTTRYSFGQASTTSEVPDPVGVTTYRGSVRFTGHGGILDLTFSDPAVTVLSRGSASLSVRVTGHGRVTIATLALTGRHTSAGTVGYSGAAATLTAAGAALFSYKGSAFYPAGTALDPVSFTIGSTATTSAAGSTTSATTATTAAATTSSATTAAISGCPATAARLTWGFKESFRAYISGSIANGEWTTSGKASYRTPVFRWSNGAGTWDQASSSGRIAFTGTVRFTGHNGALDTRIDNPVVVLDGSGGGELLLDYSGTSMDAALSGTSTRDTLSGVDFVRLDLASAVRTSAGDTITLTDIPATLTAAGHAAFPNYPAGTSFDPITLSFTVESSCASALPTTPTAAPTAAGTASTAPSGTSWPDLVTGGLAGVALAVPLTWWLTRRFGATA